MKTILQTDRLLLTEWVEEDIERFSAMNADQMVMRFYPSVLSAEKSRDLAEKIRTHFDLHGFGLYAVRLREGSEFIGYTGLNVPAFQTHFTPCVEMGWRLAYEHQGKGFATEAAIAVRDFAFTELSLRELVAFTVPANQPSRRVMEKLGMHHDPNDDFEHPSLPEAHPLRPHVLYRISVDDWLSDQRRK